MPAVRPSVSALDGESREKAEKKASDELRMKGLLIDQVSLLEAMESDGEGRYIQASKRRTDRIPAPAPSLAAVKCKEFYVILKI